MLMMMIMMRMTGGPNDCLIKHVSVRQPAKFKKKTAQDQDEA